MSTTTLSAPAAPPPLGRASNKLAGFFVQGFRFCFDIVGSIRFGGHHPKGGYDGHHTDRGGGYGGSSLTSSSPAPSAWS
jgi:hypothetical protein